MYREEMVDIHEMCVDTRCVSEYLRGNTAKNNDDQAIIVLTIAVFESSIGLPNEDSF